MANIMRIRESFAKNILYILILVVATSTSLVPAKAGSWKTIHVNVFGTTYQIDLQSITKLGNIVFANARQEAYLSGGELTYVNIEIEIDCEERVIEETIFAGSSILENIQFKQSNGEWWNIHQVERGYRDCSDFICKIAEKPFLEKGSSYFAENDKHMNSYYNKMCGQ